jgi:beta-glucanase (GH16 family)
MKHRFISICGAPWAGWVLALLLGSVPPLWAGPPSDDYGLVWQDEFDGTRLDPAKWTHHAPGPRRDAFNVKEAVTLNGQGQLLITTTRAGSTYHTGMISTRGNFETTYGYFEARIKVQREIGHWCAFWLMPNTMGRFIGHPDRAGTEIDVMEYLANGTYRDKALHTVHWDGYGKHHKSRGVQRVVPGIRDGFHTFGLEWTPEAYIFYVDGRETWRFDEAVSKTRQYLLLSVEVGTWAGAIAEAKLPDSMWVDYVRVYKKKTLP